MNPDVTMLGIDTATWTVYAAVFVTILLLAVCGIGSLLEDRKQAPSLERKHPLSRRTVL